MSPRFRNRTSWSIAFASGTRPVTGIQVYQDRTPQQDSGRFCQCDNDSGLIVGNRDAARLGFTDVGILIRQACAKGNSGLSGIEEGWS